MEDIDLRTSKHPAFEALYTAEGIEAVYLHSLPYI